MKFSLKKVLVGIIVIVALGGGAYYLQSHAVPVTQTYKTPEEAKDVYVRFAMEAYDSIMNNYWASTSEANLAGHFQLSLQKAINSSLMPVLASQNRAGTATMLENAFVQATSTDARKKLTLDTLVVALYNLPPIGHGELLSATQETSLRQNVSNVNPQKDLYQDLGLAKGADTQQVQQAYEQKAAVLEKSTTTEAKAELQQIAYAKKVLANPNTKDLYDAAKIEPTVTSKILGKTLYIGMGKIAPTTFIEFGRSIVSASTTPNLDSMIIDLRGNLGGALDFAQNFLGLFLGNSQFAFDLYHQGNYDVQRTVQGKFDELSRYKDIAVLTDNMTQSTAEVTTAAMKRFHLAHVVGDTTRGWGTVENTFPLQTVIDPTQSYSLLLVHSLTLRDDDNQPIEGRGVDPDVSIKNPNWRSELSKFFSSTSLISALKTVASEPPIK